MSDVKEGDWVCYMSAGKLVYSKVEYLTTKESGFIKTPTIVTTLGSVPASGILEVRGK